MSKATVRPDTEVVKRIRKILRRTEEAGCTRPEAEAAFALASRLMAEHSLDMAEIGVGEDSGDIGWFEDDVASVGGKWSLQCRLAYSICAEFCFVTGWTREDYPASRNWRLTKTLRFFGKPSNVDAARWMFSSLLVAFDRLFADYRKDHYGLVKERPYYLNGVADGFRRKMRQERASLELERDSGPGGPGATSLALTSLLDEVKRAFFEAHPGFSPSKPKKPNPRSRPKCEDADLAYSYGYSAGLSLSLDRPIEDASTKSLPRS